MSAYDPSKVRITIGDQVFKVDDLQCVHACKSCGAIDAQVTLADGREADFFVCAKSADEVRSEEIRLLRDAVNRSCTCGRKGQWECCPACVVWHRMTKGRFQDPEVLR